MNYTIRLKMGENGWWVATVDELPEAISQGRTVASALVNLGDAVRVVMGLEKT